MKRRENRHLGFQESKENTVHSVKGQVHQAGHPHMTEERAIRVTGKVGELECLGKGRNRENGETL